MDLAPVWGFGFHPGQHTSNRSTWKTVKRLATRLVYTESLLVHTVGWSSRRTLVHTAEWKIDRAEHWVNKKKAASTEKMKRNDDSTNPEQNDHASQRAITRSGQPELVQPRWT